MSRAGSSADSSLWFSVRVVTLLRSTLHSLLKLTMKQAHYILQFNHNAKNRILRTRDGLSFLVSFDVPVGTFDRGTRL